MVDAEKLEQAQVRVAKAQDVLEDVGKVLAAAERAQVAADRPVKPQTTPVTRFASST